MFGSWVTSLVLVSGGERHGARRLVLLQLALQLAHLV